MDKFPAVYVSHGAPPLVESEQWVQELTELGVQLGKPTAILVVSAHWESAPITLGATRTVPLIYDFWGFPQKYYSVQYPAPGAPDLANRIEKLFSDEVVHDESRGLDHGAYVPLKVMYPQADVPVLSLSLPTLDPVALFKLGQRLAPLREEGVLLLGSGFFTHNLAAFSASANPDAMPPDWSIEFDQWGRETLVAGDYDAVLDFTHRAPAAKLAHPRTEHFAPLFLALGASNEEPVQFPIEGFWYGLSKRTLRFG